MYDIFVKRLIKQGIAFVLICTLALVPVSGLDKSYAEASAERAETGAKAVTPSELPSLKATATAYNKIKLSWSKVAGAEGYEIYKSMGTADKYAMIKAITANAYTDSVTLGKVYYYRIKAYDVHSSTGEKVYLAEGSIKMTAMVPTPTIDSVGKASYNSLKVTWGEVSGVDGYIVYRSTSENGFYRKIETVKGGKKTSYTDKRRTTGRYYYYKVKAYKKSGGKSHYSDYSEDKVGRTTPEKTKFNKETVYGYKSVTLTWNKSSGAEGYKIYRSTGKSSGYKLVKTVRGKNRVKWTNEGLNARKTYYYKVSPYTKVDGTVVNGAKSSAYKKNTVPKEFNTLTRKYKTVDYVYGGNSPRGWDCSGFTQWSAKYVSGKKIPRTASAQAVKGKKISKSNMSKWKPGDILLYSDPGGQVCHSAMYVGNGKMMHALNSRFDTLIQSVDSYERWDSYTTLKYVKRY